MKGKTLVVLAALTLLLGGFIFFYEKDLPSSDERRALSKKIVDVADLGEKIDSIEIRRDDETLRFNKDGELWRLVASLEARADKSLIDGLIVEIESLEAVRVVEGLARSDAGLDPPAATLILGLDDGGEIILEIGDEIPGGSDRLIAHAGADEIRQTSGSFMDDLDRPAGDWRDKALFPHTRDAIERFVLRAGDAEVELVRRDDDFWIESPLVDLADQTAVGRLVNTLTGLAAAQFLEDSEGAADFAPELRLEAVVAGRNEPFVFEWSGDLARADGQLVRFDDDALSLDGESFFVDAQRWRSPAWTNLQVYKIDEANLRDAIGEIVLTRDDGDWRRDGESISYAAASDLLYALVEVRAQEIRDGEFGADADLSFELVTEDEVVRLSCRFLSDGRAEVAAEGRAAVLILSTEDAQKIRDKMDALRAAEVRDEAAEATE